MLRCIRRITLSSIFIPAYVFIPLRQQTPALRHPCIRLKPAPKGDRHVDVYPAVLPRCNPRTPSAGDYSHEETIPLRKRTLNSLEGEIVILGHSCTQHLGYE